MGMTNMQCAISGIPIRDQDDIFYIPLLKNSVWDEDGQIYGISFQPEYIPWSLPVPGKYDMYATGILDAGSPAAVLFAEQLKLHMEPVESKFDWENVTEVSPLKEIQSAIYYGRVKVRSFKEAADHMLDAALSEVGLEDRLGSREYQEPQLLRYALVLKTVWHAMVASAKQNYGVWDDNVCMPQNQNDFINMAPIGDTVVARLNVLGNLEHEVLKDHLVASSWEAHAVFEYMRCANRELRPSKIIGQGTPYWFAHDFASTVAEKAEESYEADLTRARREEGTLVKGVAIDAVLKIRAELTDEEREDLIKALREAGGANG